MAFATCIAMFSFPQCAFALRNITACSIAVYFILFFMGIACGEFSSVLVSE